jgi:hypothetical protein
MSNKSFLNLKSVLSETIIEPQRQIKNQNKIKQLVSCSDLHVPRQLRFRNNQNDKGTFNMIENQNSTRSPINMDLDSKYSPDRTL